MPYVDGLERLIGAAKLYEQALIARGAARTTAEYHAALAGIERWQQELQEAVLELGVVHWLAHVDD